ncbi:MAG: FAD:protein FMN transferase [Planctomycetes bacterium]|nr:FAD:protein FMN transferase [Planctomycetota bacterium]
MREASFLRIQFACLLALAEAATSLSAQAVGASRGRAQVERVVVAMGTTLRVEVTATDRATGLAATEAAVRAVEAVEQRLSAWRDDSEVSRLNRASIDAPFALSTELRADLEMVAGWWRSTDGAFDPTIGALFAVYDLRGGGRWPDAEALRAARHTTGFAHVAVVDGAMARRRAVQFDTGAFGKGLALDAAAAAARTAGASAATLDFGGQLLVSGGIAERTAALAIADPRDRRRSVLRLEIPGGSVATTGNSEHGRIVDGRRLGHVLDPRSGLPAEDFGSVTVWCTDAAAADAYSTALFVMGPDQALRWAAAHEQVEALALQIVGDTLRARATPKLRSRLTALVPDVQLP